MGAGGALDHGRPCDGAAGAKRRELEMDGIARSGTVEPGRIRSALAEIKAPSAGLITFGDNPDDNRTVMSILITFWVAILTTIYPLAEAFADIPPERRFTVKAWMQGENYPCAGFFRSRRTFLNCPRCWEVFLPNVLPPLHCRRRDEVERRCLWQWCSMNLPKCR